MLFRSGVNVFGPAMSPVAMANASIVHRSTAEAVTAALRTAYEVVPRSELLEDIRASEPLTRAAALAVGGGRLAAEHLPLILQLADDNDPALQKAAQPRMQSVLGPPPGVARHWFH